MSAKQAQQLYEKDPELRDTLLSVFTDEELGIDKPFRWEDLGYVTGSWVTTDAEIDEYYLGLTSEYSMNKNIYPSKADAKKALAEAQLRQLAKHYNDGQLEEEWIDWENYSQHKWHAFYEVCKGITSSSVITYNISTIWFKRSKDLVKCIEDNKDLWYDYFKVPRKYRRYE